MRCATKLPRKGSSRTHEVKSGDACFWLACNRLMAWSMEYAIHRIIVDEPVVELLKLGRTVIQVSFPNARQAAANLGLDISTRH
jgi:hypothetical protein